MNALVKYEAARRALAEAKSTDEVKQIRDSAVERQYNEHKSDHRAAATAALEWMDEVERSRR